MIHSELLLNRRKLLVIQVQKKITDIKKKSSKELATLALDAMVIGLPSSKLGSLNQKQAEGYYPPKNYIQNIPLRVTLPF